MDLPHHLPKDLLGGFSLSLAVQKLRTPPWATFPMHLKPEFARKKPCRTFFCSLGRCNAPRGASPHQRHPPQILCLVCGWEWGCANPKILRSFLSNFIFCTRMLNSFLKECFVSLRLFRALLAAVGGGHSDTQSLFLVLSILISREFVALIIIILLGPLRSSLILMSQVALAP